MVATGMSGLIGGVTFSGSLIAFAKLQEIKAFKKPISVPGQQVVNVGELEDDRRGNRLLGRHGLRQGHGQPDG